MEQTTGEGTTPPAPPARTASVPAAFVVGIVLITAISVAPLLLESRPIHLIAVSPRVNLAGPKALVVLLLLMGIGLGLWADRRALRRPLGIGCVLAVLAGLMTVVHARMVDTRARPTITVVNGQQREGVAENREWQRYLYQCILNGRPLTELPHIYRPLPYGFTRVLELASGDWWFACVAYRCFFNFWLLWASYRFVLYFSTPLRAWLALGIVLALYPFSIYYYWGQLTDPMSHALFVLGLLFIVQGNWLGLLLAMFAGVLAKETAVLLAIAYLAVYWRQGLLAWVRGAVVGLGAVAAFLAARLPLGWRPGVGSIHAVSGLMITTNLGIGVPLVRSLVPVYQEYLHAALFIGIFIPAIVWHWRRTDPRLRGLYLSLMPLVLLSSLCFSWLHESRNFVPLLPIELAIILACAPSSS